MIAYFDTYKILQNSEDGVVLCKMDSLPAAGTYGDWKPIFSCDSPKKTNMGFDEMVGYGRAIADLINQGYLKGVEQ